MPGSINHNENNSEIVLEQASDGIFISDQDQRYIQVNSSACRMTGYTRKELLRMGIGDISATYVDDPDRFRAFYRGLLRGESLLLEDQLRRADGTLLPIEVSAKLMPDGRIQAFVRDIYLRKLAEEKLRKSEEQFRLLADTTPNIVISTDSAGNVTYINQRWMNYTGLGSVQAKNWKIAIHPEDLWDVRAQYRNALDKGCDLESEFRLRRADGMYRWFLSRVRAQKNAYGKIEAWVASLTDIHDQKLLAQAYHGQALSLENQRKWLEGILGQIPTPVILVGKEGEVVYTNRPSDDIFGVPRMASAQAVIDRQIFFYPSGQPLTQVSELPHSRIARGENLQGFEMTVKINERQYAFLISGGSLPALYGHPATFILTLHDITALKNITEQLKHSNYDLDLFASVASHDLREPLRTITSYVTLLSNRYREKLDEDAKVYINFAVDAASRMKSLIEQTLEYSRSGKPNKPPEIVDCGIALEKALQNLHVAIAEKKACLYRQELPAVKGYPTQIEQLFQNLIGNALKFNQGTTPEIRIGVEKQERDFLFSISDNGIGIEPADQEKIFAPFRRVFAMSEYSGSGLGLAICKRIVDAHGGKIWVKSSPGNGSTFYFTLPACSATLS